MKCFALVGVLGLCLSGAAGADSVRPEISVSSFSIKGVHGNALFDLLAKLYASPSKMGRIQKMGIALVREEKPVDDALGRAQRVRLSVGYPDKPDIVCTDYFREDGKRAVFGALCEFQDSPWTRVTTTGFSIFQAQGTRLVDVFKEVNFSKVPPTEKKPYVLEVRGGEKVKTDVLLRASCFQANFSMPQLDNGSEGEVQTFDECAAGTFEVVLAR